MSGLPVLADVLHARRKPLLIWAVALSAVCGVPFCGLACAPRFCGAFLELRSCILRRGITNPGDLVPALLFVNWVVVFIAAAFNAGLHCAADRRAHGR